jgi:hypothetical protein
LCEGGGERGEKGVVKTGGEMASMPSWAVLYGLEGRGDWTALLREVGDVIINGSRGIASISDGRIGLECTGALEDLRDWTAAAAFMARFRRLIIMQVEIRTTRRIKMAPPTMPPSSGVVRPLVGVLLAAVLGISVASDEALGMADGVDEEVAAAVGACGVAAVITVVVRVYGWKLASVVVKVSVIMKVVIEVA